MLIALEMQGDPNGVNYVNEFTMNVSETVGGPMVEKYVSLKYECMYAAKQQQTRKLPQVCLHLATDLLQQANVRMRLRGLTCVCLRLRPVFYVAFQSRRMQFKQ